MAKDNPNKIEMVRGDTHEVQVHIVIDEQEYTPTEGDIVRFAVKHTDLKRDGSDYKDETPLILKEIPIETMRLKLDPEDTKELAFGTYVYDIEITFSDGAVSTFIKASPFILTKEVH